MSQEAAVVDVSEAVAEQPQPAGFKESAVPQEVVPAPRKGLLVATVVVDLDAQNMTTILGGELADWDGFWAERAGRALMKARRAQNERMAIVLEKERERMKMELIPVVLAEMLARLPVETRNVVVDHLTAKEAANG